SGNASDHQLIPHTLQQCADLLDAIRWQCAISGVREQLALMDRMIGTLRKLIVGSEDYTAALSWIVTHIAHRHREDDNGAPDNVSAEHVARCIRLWRKKKLDVREHKVNWGR